MEAHVSVLELEHRRLEQVLTQMRSEAAALKAQLGV